MHTTKICKHTRTKKTESANTTARFVGELWLPSRCAHSSPSPSAPDCAPDIVGARASCPRNGVLEFKGASREGPDGTCWPAGPGPLTQSAAGSAPVRLQKYWETRIVSEGM
eukprot:Tamp_34600.p1 GENE.Tamp_34600~~Tamp_34600.p1  ORF type:complete len:111 (-),score=3.76 Tamp_34600:119-451(-)